MSGPIVRKYGFPNFEKIFGERPLEHGSDTEAQPEDKAQASTTSGTPSENTSKKKASPKKKK